MYGWFQCDDVTPLSSNASKVSDAGTATKQVPSEPIERFGNEIARLEGMLGEIRRRIEGLESDQGSCAEMNSSHEKSSAGNGCRTAVTQVSGQIKPGQQEFADLEVGSSAPTCTPPMCTRGVPIRSDSAWLIDKLPKQLQKPVHSMIEHEIDRVDPFGNIWDQMPDTSPMAQENLRMAYVEECKDERCPVLGFWFLVFAALGMPFGMIGSVTFGIVGWSIARSCIACIKCRRRKKQLEHTSVQRRRLKSILRWATERLRESCLYAFPILEMVVLEFTSVAELAGTCKQARKDLSKLNAWLSQKHVSLYVWRYIDDVMAKWQDLSRENFVRSMNVFKVLASVHKHSCMQNFLDTRAIQGIEGMLAHESIIMLLDSSTEFPSIGDLRVNECMDHLRCQFKDAGQMGQVPSRKSDFDLSGANSLEKPLSERIPIGANSEARDDASTEASPTDRTKLKEPFFKDYTDFMQFDVLIKHKMPITYSEKNLIKDQATASTDGWTIAVDRKEIKVASKGTDTGNVCVRAWATVRGLLLPVAFYMFHNLEKRKSWDRVFADIKLVEDNVRGSDVVFCLLQIMGFTSREFLQFRRVFVEEDGSIVIMQRSAQHQSMPENGNTNVRVESHISGYHFRQEWDGDTPVLKLFLMSCADVKGMIPKWLINTVAPRKPSEWINSMKHAALGYQNSKANCETECKEYVQKFAGLNPWDYDECVQ